MGQGTATRFQRGFGGPVVESLVQPGVVGSVKQGVFFFFFAPAYPLFPVPSFRSGHSRVVSKSPGCVSQSVASPGGVSGGVGFAVGRGDSGPLQAPGANQLKRRCKA